MSNDHLQWRNGKRVSNNDMMGFKKCYFPPKSLLIFHFQKVLYKGRFLNYGLSNSFFFLFFSCFFQEISPPTILIFSLFFNDFVHFHSSFSGFSILFYHNSNKSESFILRFWLQTRSLFELPTFSLNLSGDYEKNETHFFSIQRVYPIQNSRFFS